MPASTDLLRNVRQRIRGFLQRQEYMRLLKNFFSLSFLNLLNFLLPLLTLPYLVHVLGAEKYGLTVFALAVINYFSLIVNYGFNFSGTRQISVARDDPGKVARIFWSIFALRLFLTAGCLVILLVLLSMPWRIVQNPTLYLYTFGAVAGNALIPVWLFQGMERMKYITLVQSIPRLLFTAMVFIFIREESDYLYVNLLSSCGFLVGGAFSLWLAMYAFRIRPVWPGLTGLREQLREGWHVFVSTVFMNLYRESNSLILGVMTNYAVVGYYSAAERIMKACQSLFYPVSETLFPYMSKAFSEGRIEDNLRKLYRLGKGYAMVLGVFALALFAASDMIVSRFLGPMYPMAVANLHILSGVILFGGLNYLVGIIGLVNLGMSRRFTIAVMTAGIVSVAVCVSAAPVLLDRAASWAMLISEMVLFAVILYFLKKSSKRVLPA